MKHLKNNRLSDTGLMPSVPGFHLDKRSDKDIVIALAGNPNVGKSTVFNTLTGMHQHTGNWPGKTVDCAQGRCSFREHNLLFVDLPGTYSLFSHSAEEEVARDFIYSGEADLVVAVCDATCLERNLNLVLQIRRLTGNLIVCVNLCDEAERKGIHIDFKQLSRQLKLPVVACCAARKQGITELKEEILIMSGATQRENQEPSDPPKSSLSGANKENENEMCSLCSAECNESLADCDTDSAAYNSADGKIFAKNDSSSKEVFKNDFSSPCSHCRFCRFCHDDASELIYQAELIAKSSITYDREDYQSRDRKIDRIMTGPVSGTFFMLLLLLIIFWITISGANYPSALLSDLLFRVEDHLLAGADALGLNSWFKDAFILGIYRVLAWVVSVMLPPMAIFFPLFTILEDLGYLPRIAFNMDRYFKKCKACGKQALTMCMGFGCNAVGVSGCRIIDSPRERLIAILTNVFVPCNGRFPTLIAVLTIFFVGFGGGPWQGLTSALLLTGIILSGILITFLCSRLLSSTVLKGMPSSFTLELPPYRKPQVGKVIVNSIINRTIFVLGRAVMVAAPAGLLIWMLGNIHVGGMSLLLHCASFLDPFASLMGLDGVILLAFILGFPANEIVIPLIIMGYLSTGTLTEAASLPQLQQLLIDNGWTWATAVSVVIFSLMHWPCSTTCLTIKKETKSMKWTAFAFVLPTCLGIICCIIFTAIVRAAGLI